jgi:feruloyl esterase
MDLLWNVRAMSKENGRPRLSADDLRLVHEAVLARCDLDDGVRDGIVSRPWACAFDPVQLACKTGKTPSCLMPDQVTALQKVYAGPTTSTGESLDGGILPGAELSLFHDVEGLHGASEFVANEFRYSAFEPSPGPTWRISDFDFDRDYKRFGFATYYDNSNPDLRRFKAAGGKLIVYHGGADTTDPPQPVIDYYETVERTMGGRKATQDFFRLFLIPGMNHCVGGVGALDVDWLGAIEDWVERGRAPAVLVGEPAGHGTEPSFTRPLYPYPAYAKYKGRGDPHRAENFAPAQGAPAAR